MPSRRSCDSAGRPFTPLLGLINIGGIATLAPASLAMPSKRSCGSAGRPFTPLLGLINNGNKPPFATRLECNGSVALGEDRVVAPDSRAGAGTEAGPALADDDRPGGHALAVEDLDAEHLRVRVAPVPGRAEPLLVGHQCPFR